MIGIGLDPAIPKRLWEKPLELGLMIDDNIGLCMPFSRYVLQDDPTNLPVVKVPQFSGLPAELQLRIFSFCNSSTLFRLMQVSSTIRLEAKKLFFSDPDAWYCVDAKWIFEGCYPGDTTHDIEFLLFVEQLEVVFPKLDEDDFLAYCCDMGVEAYSTCSNTSLGVDKVADGCFRGFWQRIQTRFPRVSRVILSSNFPQKVATLPVNHCKRIKQMCIPGIEVFYSFFTYSHGLLSGRERRIWRELKDNEIPCEIEGWAEIPNYSQMRIIMPPKKFRGPIGAFEAWLYKSKQLDGRREIVKTMLVTAMERYHFYGRHEPFTCPVPECWAWFDHPDQFTTHMLVKEKINIDGDHIDFLEQLVPPEPFESLFVKNDEELEKLDQEVDKRLTCFRDQWDLEGTEKRGATMQIAIHQVEHDPLCLQGGKSAMRSKVLGDLLVSLDG